MAVGLWNMVIMGSCIRGLSSFVIIAYRRFT